MKEVSKKGVGQVVKQSVKPAWKTSTNRTAMGLGTGSELTATTAEASVEKLLRIYRNPKKLGISAEVVTAAVEAAVEAIWVTDGGYENEATVEVFNETDKHISNIPFYVSVTDARSGNIEFEEYIGRLHARPYSKESYQILVRDLPYPGIKMLYGRVASDEITCSPSGRILTVTAERAFG